jgi:hypothetical protein
MASEASWHWPRWHLWHEDLALLEPLTDHRHPGTRRCSTIAPPVAIGQHRCELDGLCSVAIDDGLRQWMRLSHVV